MAPTKPGPKEQKLREQRETRPQPPKNIKMKAKGIGRVANVRISKRGT